MDDEVYEPPAKRFKHQSYQRTLKDVHLPSALVQSKFDHDIADNQSHFHEALEHWRQLNLSPGFVKFAGKADGLSASLPLLLHHSNDIVTLWLTALETSDDEGLRALLDLMQKLAHDLRTTISSSYPQLLERLLILLQRSLSAPALTALLATFSALFKYLLVPSSTDEPLIYITWTQIASALPKCEAETQRAMAEVWGSLLRRVKSGQREGVVKLMVEGLEGVEDACAWAVIFACKSVSQTLHTATASVIRPLVRAHIESTHPALSLTCVRRVLTALIHHVKGSEQFSPVAEVVLEEFTAVSAEDDEERLGRALDIASIVSSVRHGSRLTPQQVSTLVSHFPSLPLTPTLHDSLLHFALSTVTAGDMALWIGPGRKLIEHSWKDLSLGMKLCGALSELQWGGWKLVESPHVVKLTSTLLAERPKEAVSLLAALWKAGRLSEVDQAWKGRVEEWVGEWFGRWERTEEKIEEMHDVLALMGVVPAKLPLLVAVAEGILQEEDVLAEYEASYANSSWVLGACLEQLSKPLPKGAKVGIPVREWAEKIVEKWNWSEHVLGALVALVEARPPSGQTLALTEVYPHLQASLLSHSRNLRLAVLRLLNGPLVKCTAGQPSKQAIEKVLQAEEVALDVQGVRERSLRISRLDQFISVDDETGADIAVRWLLAQLQVNLRPIWKPAVEALSSLSERMGDVVWELTFAELRTVTSRGEEDKAKVCLPGWASSQGGGDDGDGPSEGLDDVREDERTWRDPSAHKVRTAVAKWKSGLSSRGDIVRAQRPTDRLDRATYHSQLLAALGACTAVAEKNNRTLVPFFLELVGQDRPPKLARPTLSAWLALFSKLANPRVLYATDSLHALYVSLLAHPDRSLQGLALSCILTYKSPHLLRHEDKLRGLLDETRWRDVLTALDLAEVGEEDRKQLVDVVVRLLFGIMLERKGRSRGMDRRAAVLTALGGCTDDELNLLVDLMLKPLLLDDLAPSSDSTAFAVRSIPADVSAKQQLGFLNLLGDVLRNLGARLTPRWNDLLTATISLVARAQSRLESHKEDKDAPEQTEEDEKEEDVPDDDEESTSGSQKTVRQVRQLGLKRYADFFRNPASFDFSEYIAVSFKAFISPRLATLSQENTQAPSALLDLFYVWASRKEYVGFLVDFDGRVLPQIYACLVAPGVKPAVVSRVLDLIDRLLQLSSDEPQVADHVVKPHVSVLLTHLSTLVERTKKDATVSNPLTQRQISILSQLSHYLTDTEQAETLLSLVSPLLRKTNKVVGEKVKTDLLKIVGSLIPSIPAVADAQSAVFVQLYELLSTLFLSVRSRQARLALVVAFTQLLNINEALPSSLADLVASLNAYSTKRLDEPDFDRRVEAFNQLNETEHATFSPQHWLPVLYNSLHFIQDPEELAIRSNSAQAMKHFTDRVAAHPDSEYQTIFLRKLYPALKNSLRSRNEMVRAEVLGVIAYAIAKCDHLNTFQDMRVLLAGGDEEANFFNNVHHIQLHRRTRALRRLADFCDEGRMRSVSLVDVFVPLVGNFIASTTDVDHHLVTEAIRTTGRMARQLGWGAYYALVQQYLRLSRMKNASERVYIRTLVTILDNFHFPMGDIVDEEKEEEPEQEEAAAEVEQAELEEEPVVVVPAEPSGPKPVPTSRIADAVNGRLLPSLLRHLERRDENEDTLRIPISIGIINVAKHLPEADREPQVLRLLTILSQVFRSRSQETRDLARDTFARIAVILGSKYLPIMLRELRAALLRGPHLHVLAYATHALLVHITNSDNVASFKNLDECVADVAHVSAEVIFGEPGKDTKSEGFKTKMREVRSSTSKGLDSFAIIAKHITPSKISGLLVPLRKIMRETEALKMMQQVDEVLRRIAGGLNSNEYLVPAELLVLCHTLIGQNSKFSQQGAKRVTKRKIKGDAIVQTKRNLVAEADHWTTNSFRFVVFGLDLLNTAFRRSRFDFHDPNIIARLEPMVAVIGNTLYSENSQVLVQGLKASASIVKCPLKSIEKSLLVFLRQTIDLIRQTGSTDSEVVQNAFRSLSIIIRDQPSAQVKEKDLIFILELLSPDLEEPERQTAVFTMLRAIVSRKFVVPEIYDLMDKVSEVMVTSQAKQVQELCRGVLLQFLLDYPQGKGRLRNQMTFLAKNLSYVYESGRKSVMELLSAVLIKFDKAIIKEYADMMFVGLVMVIANDDSAKCREMAAEVIKALFRRLEADQRRVILSHLHPWCSQQGKVQLTRVGCQVYGLLVDVLQTEATPYLPVIMEDLNATLVRSAQLFDQDDEGDDDESSDMDADEVLEWQIPYHALTVQSKILRVFPSLTTQPQKLPWPSIVSHLLFPHAWVRTASSRLLGSLFSAVPVAPPKPQEEYESSSPLYGVDVKDVAAKLCAQLRSPYLDEGLALQVVKNLFWVGKCFIAVDVDVADDAEGGAEDEEAEDNEKGGDEEDEDGEREVEDGDGEEGEAKEAEAEDAEEKRKDNPLAWLFSKLSYQARSAHIARRNRSANTETWYHQPSAILRWFAAMVTYMEPSKVELFLVHILTPLYRITDDDTIRDPHMDELKTTATELQDLVQQKVGTTKFANVYNKIRQNVLGVQRERRAARITRVTTNPQAAAKRKQQRGTAKKDSRKRKNSLFAERKGGLKKGRHA